MWQSKMSAVSRQINELDFDWIFKEFKKSNKIHRPTRRYNMYMYLILFIISTVKKNGILSSYIETSNYCRNNSVINRISSNVFFMS